VLAYIAWHRPAADVDPAAYERAIERFHASLAHRPPGGFAGSVAFRAAELPWLGDAQGARAPADAAGTLGGYEDWYLVESWSAVGVLEEAVLSRGHLGAHEALAAETDVSAGAVYRISEGHAHLAKARVSVWVTRGRGGDHPSIEALLGDGMDPAAAGLWRRCLGLGPAPEYCLLADEPPAGVADTRLPAGWSASVSARAVIFGG
jgi:hypothetical protein